MFIPAKAFRDLSGIVFSTFEELDDALSNIRRMYIRQLPPLYGPKQLYEFAYNKGWVKKTKSGLYFEVE